MHKSNILLFNYLRYRRAKALTSDVNAGVEEFKAALEDLKRALELSPDDSVIQQALNKIKHDLVKAKNSAQSFKGIFQTKGEKKADEDSNVDKTLPNTEPEMPKTEVLKSKEENKDQPVPVKPQTPTTTQKGSENVKEEKTIEKKKEKEKEKVVKKVEEKKEEAKKSPAATNGSDAKIDKNNEVWKMLHGNQDPNSEDYDYTLSYANQENAEVPQEISELEQLI